MSDETTALVKVEDYGLGSFDGQPLVLVTNEGYRYHRHNHGGRLDGVTFTEEFCLDDGNAWTPCRVCWPTPPPTPRTEETESP